MLPRDLKMVSIKRSATRQVRWAFCLSRTRVKIHILQVKDAWNRMTSPDYSRHEENSRQSADRGVRALMIWVPDGPAVPAVPDVWNDWNFWN
jgi:hypothetical protein